MFLTPHPCDLSLCVPHFTQKFCERVQLDSIVYNELGHPDDLVSQGGGDVDEFKALPRFASVIRLVIQYTQPICRVQCRFMRFVVAARLPVRLDYPTRSSTFAIRRWGIGLFQGMRSRGRKTSGYLFTSSLLVLLLLGARGLYRYQHSQLK